MANVLNGVETLPKISIVWVGCTNVTDRRQTDVRTTTYSERERTFTFAKKNYKTKKKHFHLPKFYGTLLSKDRYIFGKIIINNHLQTLSKGIFIIADHVVSFPEIWTKVWKMPYNTMLKNP